MTKFIYPSPKKVSKDHIWHGVGEVAIVPNFYPDTSQLIKLAESCQYDKMLITNREEYENDATSLSKWKVEKWPNWVNFGVKNIMVDRKFNDSPTIEYCKEAETLYWDVIDKVRAIQEQRWYLELRSLSPNVDPVLARRVDMWHFEAGSYMDWLCNMSPSNMRRHKLNVLMPLTDPAEGVLLQIFAGTEVVDIPLNKGSLIIFPTYKYMRINKVKSGTMYIANIPIMGVKNFR